ncbi:MAG: 50S ribosomal protein L15 [Myxococcota bacterium]
MRLHTLKAPKGHNKKRKRIGRGEASGQGKTAGKGMKGQKSRTGKGKPAPGFEGGQVPMYRRMPKRGFKNPFRKSFAVVNVDTLAAKFTAGSVVSLETLRENGLATRSDIGVRVIGRGEIELALTLTVDHISDGAREKIEKAGGSVTVVEKVERDPSKSKRARRAIEAGKAMEKRRADFSERRAAKRGSQSVATSGSATEGAETSSEGSDSESNSASE